MLCEVDSSFLVVIDIQTRLTAAMPQVAATRVLRNAGILLQAAAALAIPTLVTEQYPQGLGPTHDAIKASLSKGMITCEKTSFSACAAAEFNDAINRESRRAQIILVGMEAHVCVLQTAVELHHQGKTVFVVEDAVCARAPANWTNALMRLRQTGIIITNTESVLFEWLKNANHAQFKQLSALIR